MVGSVGLGLGMGLGLCVSVHVRVRVFACEDTQVYRWSNRKSSLVQLLLVNRTPLGEARPGRGGEGERRGRL